MHFADPAMLPYCPAALPLDTAHACAEGKSADVALLGKGRAMSCKYSLGSFQWIDGSGMKGMQAVQAAQ